MLERVLITGAQGLLGRHLAARCLEEGATALVMGTGRSQRLDDRYTHELAWLRQLVPAPLPERIRGLARHPRYDYTTLDVADPDAVSQVLDSFQPNVVIHAAAALRDEPWPALHASNVQAVIGLIEALARSGRAPLPRLILVSSGSVYGHVAPEALPLQETEACTPMDLYAVSKRTGEDVGRIVASQHRLPVITARVFNLVGPGLQHRHLAASLAGQIAAIKLGLSEPRLDVGPLESSRDFVDVRDAAAALAILAENSQPDGVYNIASGRETIVSNILDELLRLSELEGAVTIRRHASRGMDVARSVADIGLLRRLGFEPAISLTQSLQDMLDYYLTAVARSAV